MIPTRHAVTFYEDDVCLAGLVTAYATTCLQARGTVIVVATRKHQERLLKAFDSGTVPTQGRIVFMDAADTLSAFLVDDWPSEPLFLQLLEGLIAQAALEGPVRIVGEMVALLWAEGKGRAVQLEQLWDNLAACQSFSLLCVYPIQSFVQGNHTESFLEVCRVHHNHILTSPRACVPDRSRTELPSPKPLH